MVTSQVGGGELDMTLQLRSQQTPLQRSGPHPQDPPGPCALVLSHTPPTPILQHGAGGACV